MILRLVRKRPTPPEPGVVPRIDPRRRDVKGADASERPATSRLPRRDPHKEKGARLRHEMRLAGETRKAGALTAPDASCVLILDDPAAWVLAVSLSEEPWPDAEREVLGAARRLADEIGGGVVLLRLEPGAAVADAGSLGADRLVELPAMVDADAAAANIGQVMAIFSAAHVLMAEGGADADVARRAAMLLGDRPGTGAQSISSRKILIPEEAGRTEATRPPPKVITIASGRFDPYDGASLREGRIVTVEPADTVPKVRLLGTQAASRLDAPLGEARFIVSAGDGVTDWPGFRAVADALGGTLGGSRQICDAGHLPRDRQVGASGTLVEARCYLALGISGAPQHLQGIQKCRFVVAVNTDLHAAMIKRADLAIVADAQAVMPHLTRLARAGGHG